MLNQYYLYEHPSNNLLRNTQPYFMAASQHDTIQQKQPSFSRIFHSKSIFQAIIENGRTVEKTSAKTAQTPRYYFLIINKLVMSNFKQGLVLALLIVVAINQKQSENSASEFFSDYRQGVGYKKGLTFQATVWPTQQNSFVGRMSCNGCNPQLGDTSCTERLPVACIIHHKVLSRPFYNYYTDFTPYANPDNAFYEGWSGGIIVVTDPVRGLEITSYSVGDNMCKTAYGSAAKFATFTDGYYMSNMNGPNLNIEKNWRWEDAKSGQYNFWGYFNHDHVGKSWVWTQTTPSGNCIIPDSNPINGE